jgi:inositol transport system substrate-binding protein
MKKILSMFLLVTVIMGSLIGCGKEEKATGPKKIVLGIASNEYSQKWMTYLNDRTKSYAEELGVETIFTDAKSDAAIQLANVENLIVQDVDAILIVMVDPTSPGPIINACKEAGIPLIGVNRNYPGADVFIGSNDKEGGIMQMEYMANVLGNKGNIGLLLGTLGEDCTIYRTEGNKEVVDQHEGMNVVLEEVGLWDRAKGMEITENWLQSGVKIDAIVANNDEMAIGAVRALQGAGITDMPVAAIDGTIDALEYVKSGLMDVSLFYSPFRTAEISIESAIKKINGEAVEPFVVVPFEKVTAENVDKYIAIWE